VTIVVLLSSRLCFTLGASRDFAPALGAISIWARASRLSEGRFERRRSQRADKVDALDSLHDRLAGFFDSINR